MKFGKLIQQASAAQTTLCTPEDWLNYKRLKKILKQMLLERQQLQEQQTLITQQQQKQSHEETLSGYRPITSAEAIVRDGSTMAGEGSTTFIGVDRSEPSRLTDSTHAAKEVPSTQVKQCNNEIIEISLTHRPPSGIITSDTGNETCVIPRPRSGTITNDTGNCVTHRPRVGTVTDEAGNCLAHRLRSGTITSDTGDMSFLTPRPRSDTITSDTGNEKTALELTRSPLAKLFFRTLRQQITHVIKVFKKLFAEQLQRAEEFLSSPRADPRNTEACKQQLETCIAIHLNLCYLRSYGVLNYCGVRKILKKHDKISGFQTQDQFMSKVMTNSVLSIHPRLTMTILTMERLYFDLSGANIATISNVQHHPLAQYPRVQPGKYQEASTQIIPKETSALRVSQTNCSAQLPMHQQSPRRSCPAESKVDQVLNPLLDRAAAVSLATLSHIIQLRAAKRKVFPSVHSTNAEKRWRSDLV